MRQKFNFDLVKITKFQKRKVEMLSERQKKEVDKVKDDVCMYYRHDYDFKFNLIKKKS